MEEKDSEIANKTKQINELETKISTNNEQITGLLSEIKTLHDQYSKLEGDSRNASNLIDKIAHLAFDVV